MTRFSRALAAMLAAFALVFAMATPGSAKIGEGIVSIDIEDCTIVVTVASSNGGDFVLEVWDDGVVIGTDTFSVPAEGMGEGRFTITSAVLQGNPGLGIYVNWADDGEFDSVDPYHGADDILDRCSQETTTTQPSVTTWRPNTTVTTAPSTTAPSTTAPTTTETTEPGSTTSTLVTTTVVGETTTTAQVDADSGSRPPQAPPARPLAGAASYTG